MESQQNPERRLFRSDTASVSIAVGALVVWEYVADLNNWPEFSDFARNLEQISETEWITHTPQGDIRIITLFDRQRMLLDTVCVLPSGEEQFIPYRVVPNGDGAELMMTNFQADTVSDEDYAQQLKWMQDELGNIKRILELNQ